MLDIVPHHNANAEALRRIYAQSLAANPHGFVQDISFHGDIVAQAEEMDAAGGAFLAALLGGNTIGFGGLKPDTEDGEALELCKLHLLPEYHGRGYGKALSLALIETAREKSARAVTLHVTATQEAAIGLYERLGFVRTGQKIYQLETGGGAQDFDTVFMRLNLQG